MGNNFGIGAGTSRFKKTNASSEKVNSKLAIDIFEGEEQLNSFYELPCNVLREFTLKNDYDFSPWPDEKFQELMISIQDNGVLQPIIVREIEEEGFYEILAGEHRWKASVALGLKKIPARIIYDCNDDHAKSIFTLTNVMTRELTRADQIQGWAHYYEITKGKTQETIKKLVEQGIIEPMDGDSITRRHIFRFYRINSLHPDLRQIFMDGKLGLLDGERLESFSQEEQELLAEYAEQITSKKIINGLLTLQKNALDSYTFDKAGIEYILSGEFQTPKEVTVSTVLSNAKPIIQKKIKKSDYGRSNEIISDALDLYNQYNGQKKLLKKAVAEYIKNHPEEDTKLDDDWMSF